MERLRGLTCDRRKRQNACTRGLSRVVPRVVPPWRAREPLGRACGSPPRNSSRTAVRGMRRGRMTMPRVRRPGDMIAVGYFDPIRWAGEPGAKAPGSLDINHGPMKNPAALDVQEPSGPRSSAKVVRFAPPARSDDEIV